MGDEMGVLGGLGLFFLIFFLTDFFSKKSKLKRAIEKKETRYGELSIILTAGIYTTGIDFPKGKYNLFARESYGNVYSIHSNDKNKNKNRINQTMGVGYKNIAPEFYNLELDYLDTFNIEGDLVLELFSEKINLNVVPREVKGKEITLRAGNYEVGKDIELGVYDIQLIKNNGYFVRTDKKNPKFERYMGDNYGELKIFKNCPITILEGRVEIFGGLVVKLTPSQGTYMNVEQLELESK